ASARVNPASPGEAHIDAQLPDRKRKVARSARGVNWLNGEPEEGALTGSVLAGTSSGLIIGLRLMPPAKSGGAGEEAKNADGSLLPNVNVGVEDCDTPKDVITPINNSPQTTTPKAPIMAGLKSKSRPRRCRQVTG